MAQKNQTKKKNNHTYTQKKKKKKIENICALPGNDGPVITGVKQPSVICCMKTWKDVTEMLLFIYKTW